MPIKKASIKDLRQSKAKAVRNKKAKENLQYLLKKSRKFIQAKDKNAKEYVLKTIQALDKAVQKGMLKKNTAARKKSRLMKKLNLVKAK